MNILSTSAAVLPPNTALPSLPAWRAPSFWAQLLIFGIWAWVERRAPHFRLTFWKAAP